MYDYIGLDFETYSAVDLRRHGLHRYVSSSTFTPLVASVAWYDEGHSKLMATTYDFIADYDQAVYHLAEAINNTKHVVAHNAGFEQRVLAAIGIDVPSKKFIDSAVVARARGFGSSLEAAAPQMLGTDKLASGRDLIRLFCIPGPLQEETDCLGFDKRIVEQHPAEWAELVEYCELDAELSLRIGLSHPFTDRERTNMAVTMDMNNLGWPVDVPMVEEMQRRYLENLDEALCNFRLKWDADDLNLNSLKQLKEWCEERGVRAKSFDEKNTAALLKRIDKKLLSMQLLPFGTMDEEKYDCYLAVRDLLDTKQILGGSSLKKLQVILDTVGKDCRLRDQYLHIGAGQSWRTTGRSVQMQNLKRLAEPADMMELFDDQFVWDNTKLAQNLRQVFTSSHPQGRLIVGDFASVESRGLAWLAGEQWKLDSYARGQDMYKVLAANMFDVDYYDVTKPQRQAGKVGELSCGYGAGGGAVQMFAENMGIEMTEGEAQQLVTDWRLANPKVVQLWERLDDALNRTLDGSVNITFEVGDGYAVRLNPCTTPLSLQALHPQAQSIEMLMFKGRSPGEDPVVTRVFHGCYRRGRNVCYYKPSERKTGDLWSSHFVDPKTKQTRFYSVYGGKLAGILTQSFCRELFFRSLQKVHAWTSVVEGVDLIGQFHDEIVLDWTPNGPKFYTVLRTLEAFMSNASDFPGFPLAADVKHDYRYTK